MKEPHKLKCSTVLNTISAIQSKEYDYGVCAIETWSESIIKPRRRDEVLLFKSYTQALEVMKKTVQHVSPFVKRYEFLVSGSEESGHNIVFFYELNDEYHRKERVTLMCNVKKYRY